MSLKRVLRKFRHRRHSPSPTTKEPLQVAATAESGFERDERNARLTLQRFEAPYRLHIGCGTVHVPGWVNVDRDPASDVIDISWDLRRSLPIADGSVEFIYHEHFMEHLTVQEGLELSRECLRLLKPGGVLRVGMPDLELAIRQYHEQTWRQPWMEKYGYQHIQTRAEFINIAFRDWEHQWLYDREELHRRLREAGFQTIRDCPRLESTVPELCGLETRDETLLVVEAIK